MGISDILNLSSNRNIKHASRNKDQLVVHFKSLALVNEQKFGTSGDPIVIFKAKGIMEQVKVIPFNYDNETKESLPFAEKKQYYSKKITTFRTNNLIYEDERNLDVTAVVSIDYGTPEELDFHLKNPTDLGINIEKFFGSVYLDLKDESLNEFEIGIGEILNG